MLHAKLPHYSNTLKTSISILRAFANIWCLTERWSDIDGEVLDWRIKREDAIFASKFELEYQFSMARMTWPWPLLYFDWIGQIHVSFAKWARPEKARLSPITNWPIKSMIVMSIKWSNYHLWLKCHLPCWLEQFRVYGQSCGRLANSGAPGVFSGQTESTALIGMAFSRNGQSIPSSQWHVTTTTTTIIMIGTHTHIHNHSHIQTHAHNQKPSSPFVTGHCSPRQSLHKSLSSTNNTTDRNRRTNANNAAEVGKMQKYQRIKMKTQKTNAKKKKK